MNGGNLFWLVSASTAVSAEPFSINSSQFVSVAITNPQTTTSAQLATASSKLVGIAYLLNIASRTADERLYFTVEEIKLENFTDHSRATGKIILQFDRCELLLIRNQR